MVALVVMMMMTIYSETCYGRCLGSSGLETEVISDGRRPQDGNTGLLTAAAIDGMASRGAQRLGSGLTSARQSDQSIEDCIGVAFSGCC